MVRATLIKTTPQTAATLLFYFLATTLILGFFAPPILYATKKIYIYDLVLFLLPIFTLFFVKSTTLQKHSLKHYERYFFISFAVLTLAFFHGLDRPGWISDRLHNMHAWPANKQQDWIPFSWLQDSILYIRFISWIAASFSCLHLIKIAGHQALSIPIKFAKLWARLALIESIFAIALIFTPSSFNQIFSEIYKSNPYPNVWWNGLLWAGRLSGTASSAVELAFLLLPGFLWSSVEFKEKRNLQTILPITIIGIAMLYTRSLSCIVSCAVALIYLFYPTITHILERKRKLTLLFTIPLLAGLAYFLFSLAAKQDLLNFEFRTGIWRVYIAFLFERVDYLLLGFGFSRFYTDNSYIHILRTGGLTMFFGFGYLVFQFLKTIFSIEPESQYRRWLLAFFIAIATSAFTLDTFIFRVSGTGLLFSCILSLVYVQTQEQFTHPSNTTRPLRHTNVEPSLHQTKVTL